MAMQHLLALFPLLLLFLVTSTALNDSKQLSLKEQSALPLEQQTKLSADSVSDRKGTKITDGEAPNLNVLDISERNLDGQNAIAITLSSEIDASINFQPYLVINQNKKGRVNGEWLVGKDPKQIIFTNIEPLSHYSVSINPGLRAKNGSQLTLSKSVDITTRKLLPSVNFASKGSVLPLHYQSGIPVTSINIAEVDIDFFRVRDEQLSEFSADIQYYTRHNWYNTRLSKHGVLAYTGRFKLNPKKNTLSQTNLPIHNIKALQQPGLYFAIMRVPGDYENKKITWFSVTDIGIHIRQYQNQMDVHVNSLSTGKPLKNIKLQLLNNKSEVIQENTTTPEGQASFSGDTAGGISLLAKSSKQLTLLDLRQPSIDLSNFDLGSRPQLPVELFIYSPRDLYRPGEQITFSGLIRDFDGRLNHAPVLNGNIKAPNGSTVKNFKWQPKKLGYYEYQWTIPKDAATGSWNITLTGSFQNPVSYSFHVEEFLPERLRLSLAGGATRTELDLGKDANITITGEYLYGAPAAGNRLSAFYQTSAWHSPIETLKNYQFGDTLGQNIASHMELNDVSLDALGNASIQIKNTWSNSKTPLKINLTTSLYESGGRPVTRTHPILVWPSETMVGIRPYFKDNKLNSNTVASFDIINATLMGNLLSANNIDVTLIKQDRQYFWEYTDHQGWHWEWTDKEFPVANKSISLAEGKATPVNFNVGWGNYRLVAKNTDTNTISNIQFFAGHNWYYDWKNAKNDAASPTQVNLALDKNKYHTGDTVQLKIIPPAAGEALILVEGDNPLWSKKISIPSEGTVVNIPISTDWNQHNLYISALVIEPSGTKEQITPKRSLGLIHLPLDRDDRKLNISLEAAKNIKPNSQLKTLIQLKNTTNKKTFLTLSAVDVGVLSISDFKTPDPFRHFFGARRYQVNMQDMYSKVIESNRFADSSIGFGGDADLVRGGTKPQSEVQIVSLFSGLVELDNDGRVEVPLNIPDFNGRLRLMAVAFNDDAFGSTDAEVTVAAPIIAEIAMPRFLAYGDKSSAALDIQNMTEEEESLSINITTTGAIKKLHKNLTFNLKAKEKKTLSLPIEATSFNGEGKIHITVAGDKTGELTRQWNIGIRPAYPAITQRKQQILSQNESIHITRQDLPDLIPETLQVVASMSPSIDLQVAEQLKHLLAYPYGCLEQTSSKGYPLTFANVKNQARFNISPISDEKRRDMIQKGVDRISRFQKSNGAFGLWSKDSAEEHWLSVYATDFLLNAKAMGIDVSSTTLEKAVKRLEYYLNSSGAFIHQRWSNSPEHYAFVTRAYAAYVLSGLKKAPLGSLRTLYKRSFKEAKSGLSQTYLGLALLKMGDKKNGTKALETAVENIPTDYKYWGDYGSEVRDLGMMIYLLLSNNQLEKKALELSLKLSNAVKNKTWLSTQERTALFLSGIELNVDLEEPWLAELSLNEKNTTSISSKKNWSRLFTDSELTDDIKIESKHDRPIFTNILINGYTRTPPPAENRGMSISRNWYNVTGELTVPNKIEVGDLLLVHLSITSEKRIQDAMAINLLPAGLELENQNLEHAIKLDQFKVNGQSIADLQSRNKVQHQEYRDDRFIAAIDHRYQSHLFFAVRAVTPGIYSVPAPFVEDMYRPEIHGIGESIGSMEIVNPALKKVTLHAKQ